MIRTARIRGPALLFLLLGTTSVALAQANGVTEKQVLFGQSAVLSGPAGALGREFRAGILTAFGDVNAAGGVHGRKLELLSIDDSYEPEKAMSNTHKLIEEERVFALIGAVGTPTSKAVVPIAAEAGVPYIAPYTGADFLRAAEQWTNVVNLRASYREETEEVVERLTSDLDIKRIAVLHQDDSYGHAGLVGVQQALNKRKMRLVAVGTYRRNTSAVKTAVLALRDARPEAVIVIGAYQPVAATVAWSRQLGFQPVFATISFSGGNALASELGRWKLGNIFVSQVVPFPSSATRVAARYRQSLMRHTSGIAPGFVSFEGYLAGRLAIVGLERCGTTVSRSTFLAGILRGGPISIDDFRLRFGESDNQGSDRVFLTVVDGSGDYRPVTSMSRFLD